VFLDVQLQMLERYWIIHTCGFTVLVIHVLILETSVTESQILRTCIDANETTVSLK
jgi:hypothetical protein